jgi:hypothetical protein
MLLRQTTRDGWTEGDPIALALELPDPAGPALLVAAAAAAVPTRPVGVYWTRTPGSGYEHVATCSGNTTMGWCTVDEGEALEVELIRGELSSRPRDDLDRHANLLAVGAEVLAFERAVLLRPRAYRLTGLHRARLGTSQGQGVHQAVALIDKSLSRISYGPERWADVVHLRAVRAGRPILDGEDFAAHRLEGASALPPAPADLDAEVGLVPDGLRLTWRRRSRHWGRIVGQSPIDPLDEPREAYVVEVGEFGTPPRIELEVDRPRAEVPLEELVDLGLFERPLAVSVRQVGAWGLGAAASVQATW